MAIRPGLIFIFGSFFLCASLQIADGMGQVILLFQDASPPSRSAGQEDERGVSTPPSHPLDSTLPATTRADALDSLGKDAI